MTEVAEERFAIDDRPRLAQFGLECALHVSFNGAERKRVFQDRTVDQVSEKRYVFFESARLSVIGQVDEYEPETVRLQIRGSVRPCDLLQCVKVGAELHCFRLRQSTE